MQQTRQTAEPPCVPWGTGTGRCPEASGRRRDWAGRAGFLGRGSHRCAGLETGVSLRNRGPTVHQRVTQGARLAWVQVPRTFPARRGLGFSFRSQWGSVGRLQMLRASLRRWPGLCQRPCGVAAERAATPSRPERDGGGSGADGKTGQRDRPRGQAWEYGDREGARAPSGSFPGKRRGRRTRSAGWGRGSRGRVSGDGVRSAMPETVERDSRGRGG